MTGNGPPARGTLLHPLDLFDFDCQTFNTAVGRPLASPKREVPPCTYCTDGTEGEHSGTP